MRAVLYCDISARTSGSSSIARSAAAWRRSRSAASRAAEARRQRQARAEQEIHDDPLVKALLAQYKTARIVPGSVKPL